MPLQDKKIGLALGSGSARGLAHIGILESIMEKGLPVSSIAGTSMGALVGAAFASGKLQNLKDVLINLDWKGVISFFDITIPRSGLIDGKRVEEFIREHIKAAKIEDLPIPLSIVTTDLYTGEEYIIREGDIIEAIRASMSMPGIFTPMKIGDRVLVDGGLANPVPVSVAREMGAEYIIGVDLNHTLNGEKVIGSEVTKEKGSSGEGGNDEEASGILAVLNERLASIKIDSLRGVTGWLNNGEKEEPLPNIFEVLLSSMHILEGKVTDMHLELDPPELLLQPDLGDIKFLDFNRGRDIIDIGHREADAKVTVPL